MNTATTEKITDRQQSIPVSPQRGNTASAPSQTPVDVRIAIDSVTLGEIKMLRKRRYRNIYPSMDLDGDALDQHAITLFTRNEAGRINSTARLGVGGPVGLPEDKFLDEYRATGKKLIEWGRFIIEEGDIVLLKRYYEAVFTISTQLGFDSVVMAMKPKDISLHRRLIGVKVIKDDMKITYGGPFSLACVVWELDETKPTFFKWINK